MYSLGAGTPKWRTAQRWFTGKNQFYIRNNCYLTSCVSVLDRFSIIAVFSYSRAPSHLLDSLQSHHFPHLSLALNLIEYVTPADYLSWVSNMTCCTRGMYADPGCLWWDIVLRRTTCPIDLWGQKDIHLWCRWAAPGGSYSGTALWKGHWLPPRPWSIITERPSKTWWEAETQFRNFCSVQ